MDKQETPTVAGFWRQDSVFRMASWVTIAFVILSAILYYVFSGDTLQSYGTYISGVAQLIATFWLISTFTQQMGELHAQREELSLQRRALEETSRLSTQQLAILVHKEFLHTLSASARSLIGYASQQSVLEQLDVKFAQGRREI